MEFEKILEQVGDYGKFQKRFLYCVIIPISLFLPFATDSILFMLSEPDHWCNVSHVSNLTWQDQHVLVRPPVKGSTIRDSCNYYDIDYNLEIERLYEYKSNHNQSSDGFMIQNQANQTTQKCSSWIFDNSSYDSNAMTELLIVCDRRHWKSTLLSLAGISGMLGTLFFGYCAANFGRKRMYMIALSVAYTGLIVPIFMRDLWLFICMRLLVAFSCGAINDMAFLLLTEIVKPNHRSKVIGVSATFWTVGMCLLPLVVSLVREWTYIMLIPAVVMLPFFSFIWLMPESPRWLVSKKRYLDAYLVLTRIAQVNGRVVEVDLMEQLKAINVKQMRRKSSHEITVTYVQQLESPPGPTETIEDSSSPLELLKHRRIFKHLVILTLAWISAYSTYGGLTLNFENYEGNEFMNWFLLSLVEFPSNLLSWYAMESLIGRRWTTSGSLIFGGVALCLPIFFSSDTWTLVLSLIGKFLTNMAFNVLYQQSVELFPTPLRTHAASWSSAIASAAVLGLPYVIALGKGHVWIPLVIIGSVSIAGGVATSFFPETLDQNLPQTIRDGEELGENQEFFSLAKRKKDQQRRNTLEKPRRSITLINFR